jgi:hypothetical protein
MVAHPDLASELRRFRSLPSRGDAHGGSGGQFRGGSAVSNDELGQRLEQVHLEVQALRQELRAVRHLCEQILAAEGTITSGVRQMEQLPPEDAARGDEVPLSAVIPTPGR